MGVYSHLLADEKILEEVSGFKTILILGCENCANTSVAFDMDIPLGKPEVDKNSHTKVVPTAILNEGNRLKALLESKGIKARNETRFGLCNMSDETDADDLKLNQCCADVDAVLILACPAGTMGLKRRVKKNVKVLPGMKTVGVFQKYTVTDQKKGLVFLDKSKSSILKILTT